MRLAAAGAAAGLALPGLAATPASAASAASAAKASAAGLFAQDLELVTVTDTGFVLTWYTADAPTPSIPYQPAQEPAPVPCDGVVRYGTRPDRLDRVAVQRHGDTAYHYVEVEGLRPGTTYYYQALSAGIPATPRVLPQLTFPAGGLVIPPNPTNQQLLAILAQLLSSGVVPVGGARADQDPGPAARPPPVLPRAEQRPPRRRDGERAGDGELPAGLLAAAGPAAVSGADGRGDDRRGRGPGRGRPGRGRGPDRRRPPGPARGLQGAAGRIRAR